MKDQLWDNLITELPQLGVGAHDANSKRLCALELVSFMERLPHSDHPACTCELLGAYVRQLNDRLDEVGRQRLLPYLPRLVGTADDGFGLARYQVLVDACEKAALSFCGPPVHANFCSSDVIQFTSDNALPFPHWLVTALNSILINAGSDSMEVLHMVHAIILHLDPFAVLDAMLEVSEPANPHVFDADRIGELIEEYS